MISEKFRRKVSKLLGQNIIQFSPPRSGSTLVYNILREIFPNKNIDKKHSYPENDQKFPVVVTYRHPLDSIASSIQRYELEVNQEILKQQVAEFEENGIWDVLKIKDDPNVLMLRYEDFVHDFRVIFNEIETFFNVQISEEKKQVINEKYQIKSVENVVKKMGNFENYDKVTNWHGKHISGYKGRPYYFKEFFEEEQIAYLEGAFERFLKELGYK